MTQKTLSAFRSDGPGPFPFQDSYLLSQGKDFCVERRAVREDFDDLMHAGKGIRW